MSKFDLVREMGTAGINYDITNEDVIDKLTEWDEAYGIDIEDVAHDRLVVKFQSLPEDLDELASDIYDFCPDVIEQHFGCMDDLVDVMEDSGQEISEDLAELIEDVDFEQENFGEELLQKSLRLTQQVALWWD